MPDAAEPSLATWFMPGSSVAADASSMKHVLALALISTLAVVPAGAGEDDHDRARRAVQAGEALPLRTILDKAAAQFPGELIEAELEEEHGRLIYEIKLVTPEGRVRKLLYDARDGTLITPRRQGGRP